MKQRTKLRLIIVLTVLHALLTVGLCNAQTFETVKKSGGGFDVESGTATGDTMTIDGKAFDLFETAKGSLYIKCKSRKSGRFYPVWIGQPANVRHEGKAVYMTKSGKYCIYKIGKSGNPYPVWLKRTS